MEGAREFYFFYTKSATYEWVPFRERIHESNLMSPTKLA